MDPYITVSEPQPPPTPLYAGGIDESLAYAQKLSDAYYAAVGTQSDLKNGTAFALIPLSAAALGIGLTSSAGAARNAIIGMGLGGAATYATADYLVQPSRQLIWIKGAEALTCAQQSMQPVTVTIADEQMLQTQISALAVALYTAETDLTEPNVTEVAAINTAASVLTASQNWDHMINQSGATLAYRVNAIRDRVNEEIETTDPDLAKIEAAAGSLQATSTALIPQPASGAAITAAGVPSSTTGTGFKSAPEVVADRLQDLAALQAATWRLQLELNQAIAAANAVAQPDPCLPRNTGAPHFLVGAAGYTLRAGASTDLGIAFSGNPPSAAKVSDSDMTASLNSVNGVFAVHVTATASALTGNHIVVLFDSTGEPSDQTIINVVATGAAPPTVLSPVPAPAPPPPPPPLTDFSCVVASSDLALSGLSGCADFVVIAKLLNVPNPNTASYVTFTAAVAAEKKTLNDTMRGPNYVDAKLREALSGAAPPPPASPAAPPPQVGAAPAPHDGAAAAPPPAGESPTAGAAGVLTQEPK